MADISVREAKRTLKLTKELLMVRAAPCFPVLAPSAPGMPQLRVLGDTNPNSMFVHVLAARTGEPVQTGEIELESRVRRVPLAFLAPAGWARLKVPAGRYTLRIPSWGMGVVLDSLEVRRGYADTLRLAVGEPWMCGV